MNIWFTSDTHYGHKNIVKCLSDWGEGALTQRDYPTLEAMNKQMVENINSCVEEDDILWHLGDWSFGGFDNVMKFRRELICKNIHLILGNHDHHIAKNVNLRNFFTSVNMAYGWPTGEKFNGKTLIMSHFPMLVWDKHEKGSIHIHGHCHGNLKDDIYYQRKVIDVGIDAHSEFRPFHLDEILEIASNRSIMNIDHH